MRDFYRSIRLKFSVIRSRPLLRDWDLSRELEKQLLRAGTKHNLETDQLADFRPYPLPNPAHSQIIYSPNVFGFHLFSFDTWCNSVSWWILLGDLQGIFWYCGYAAKDCYWLITLRWQFYTLKLNTLIKMGLKHISDIYVLFKRLFLNLDSFK